MAETRNPEEATPSPGMRAAALVRGAGAGTAELTERVARTSGAVVAGAVLTSARIWGDVVGVAVDGALAAVQLSTGRRHPRPTGGAAGARPCIDLTEVRTGKQIDEALASGLTAPRPRRRMAAME